MKTLLEKFVKKHRMYRPYALWQNVVEKSFNSGMGSLALFRFYKDEKIVLVNTSLANKFDMRKLENFLAENQMSDWQKVEKRYGYPEWYSHNFSIYN